MTGVQQGYPRIVQKLAHLEGFPVLGWIALVLADLLHGPFLDCGHPVNAQGPDNRYHYRHVHSDETSVLVGSGALEETGVAVEPAAMPLSELPGRAAAAAAVISATVVSTMVGTTHLGLAPKEQGAWYRRWTIPRKE